MTERLRMEDIPRRVWDKVYEKWRNALENTGWQQPLWSRCPLCDCLLQYILDSEMTEMECQICPLDWRWWCKSTPDRSLLNIHCENRCGDFWEIRVKRFLDFLKPYTTEGQK